MGMQPDFPRLQSPFSQKNIRKMFAIKAHENQIHRAASGIRTPDLRITSALVPASSQGVRLRRNRQMG